MTYVKKPINRSAPSNNQLWSDSDTKILKDLAGRGSSTSQIAKALGRTKASVWGRKSMMGIKGRLASSKGQNIDVPTTVSKKARRTTAKTPVVVTKKGEVKVIKVTAKGAKDQNAFTKATSDFEMLSRLAKQTGAKIVITFE
jgi:hypothetical protein